MEGGGVEVAYRVEVFEGGFDFLDFGFELLTFLDLVPSRIVGGEDGGPRAGRTSRHIRLSLGRFGCFG